MRIALIHHSDDLTNDYAAYLAALLDEMAEKNEYVIKDYGHLLRARESLKEENVLLHIIIPASSNFSLKYWYGFKLARIFKKYKLDIVLCLYGTCTSSPLKQLLIFPDKILAEQNTERPLWQQFASSKLQNSIKVAASVITYSAAAGETLKLLAAAPDIKVMLVPYTAPPLFVPMEWHNRLYIKSRFAENKEYFISILPDNDEKIFTDLLKAFSKFKKWQQSGMKLILLPKEEAFSRAIEEKLETYKYRDDIKLVNDAEKKDIADLIAAAYALLHMPANDADLWPVTLALQCNVPVISYSTASIAEYCGDALLPANENSFEAFADALIQLYKDETLKTKMCDAAVLKTEEYKQDIFAAKLWELITGNA